MAAILDLKKWHCAIPLTSQVIATLIKLQKILIN